MVKLGDWHAQVAENKSGEGTSAAPYRKEVVDVDSIPESVVPVEKISKKKESTEAMPETSRKKIRIISLAKRRKRNVRLTFTCF